MVGNIISVVRFYRTAQIPIFAYVSFCWRQQNDEKLLFCSVFAFYDVFKVKDVD